MECADPSARIIESHLNPDLMEEIFKARFPSLCRLHMLSQPAVGWFPMDTSKSQHLFSFLSSSSPRPTEFISLKQVFLSNIRNVKT